MYRCRIGSFVSDSFRSTTENHHADYFIRRRPRKPLMTPRLITTVCFLSRNFVFIFYIRLADSDRLNRPYGKYYIKPFIDSKIILINAERLYCYQNQF